MSEQVLGFLGLMRRAGALAVGAESVFRGAGGGRWRVWRKNGSAHAYGSRSLTPMIDAGEQVGVN